MLSQEITKLTFYIREASSSAAASRHRQKLEESVHLWLRSSVIDHGSGILDEFRQRIFQRFSQADSSDARK